MAPTMSISTLPTITPPPTRSSKRKRAPVNYCEVVSEDESTYESDAFDGETPSKKARKYGKGASNKPLPKRKIFPFLQLPQELKDMIYGYALVDPNGIFLVSKTRKCRRTVERARNNEGSSVAWSRQGHLFGRNRENGWTIQDKGPELAPLVPNLLATCRQIYEEAAPILYGNIFMFEDTTAMHGFLGDISITQRGMLRNLVLQGWGHTKVHKAMNHPAFTILASGGVNLKHLYFDCSIGWGFNAKRTAERLYRDSFHWLEAIGSAKGRKDAALDLIEIDEDKSFTRQRVFIREEEKWVWDEAVLKRERVVFRETLRKLLLAKR